MRKLLVKIVQILDGTPAIYGKRQTGQSVVELALITPLLIILLAGLVEIGWFANNYLTLLDVTRAGARRGAVLQDQQSPLSWDDEYSYVPNELLSASYQLDQSPYYQVAEDMATTGTEAQRFHYRWTPDTSMSNSLVPSACDVRYVPDRTFYSEIMCTMITSMDPLAMNPSNGIDDIIISAFAMQLVDKGNSSNPIPEYPTAGPQMVVAGRYPSNANECDLVNDGSGNPSYLPDGREGRNPFDINHNDKQDVAPPNTVANSDEVVGTFDELPGFQDHLVPSGSTDYGHMEKQVGFSLFGNHKIPNTFCVGSEWTMNQVEQLMNLPDYSMTTSDEKDVMPSQGVVLVELYWEHEMLLKIPVLSPVYTAVGNQNGKMVINVWAAFPLGSVEPHIDFPAS